MVSTVKFSQFLGPSPQEPGDITVGLRDGKNYQFYAGGGSGGGTTIITQPGNNLVLGNWVRINNSGQYVLAQADTAQDGEVIGMVVQIVVPNQTFALQQSGYVTTATGAVSGLSEGVVYFLDTATMGAMVPTDAVINGQISRPVFVSDSPTSGWIVPYRPLIVGGAAPPGPSPSSSDELIVTVNQVAHGFTEGTWLRVNTDNTTGPVSYTKAYADTLANAQVAGVVILPITSNQFTLQFAGYNTGAVTVDYAGGALVSSNTYYLSNQVMGTLQLADPLFSGGISKPVYTSEQTTNFLGGMNAGYILPQRPISSITTGNVYLGQLNAGNNFSSTNILSGFAANVYLLMITGEISALAAAPTFLGVRMYGGGTFTNVGNGYQMYGVKKDVPITGTPFSAVDLGNPIPPCCVLFPPIYRNPASNGSIHYLQLEVPGLAEMIDSGNYYEQSTGLSYSVSGTTSCIVSSPVTGVEIFAGIGVPILGPGYVSVYAIPNS